MKKATLVVSEEEQKRLAFGAMIASHVGVLPKAVIDKFSRNEYRAEIPDRLLQAFTSEEVRAPLVGTYKAEETNLSEAIILTEQFALNVLGQKVSIREKFELPEKLPWKNVLVTYDPGLNNREAIDKALKSQGLDNVYEECDVMKYGGSSAMSYPTLRIIENSLRPTEDTLGDNAKSPNQLKADGRLYLGQRGYMIAFGLRYFGFKDYLDPKIWTWFPESRLSGGWVARGCWNPDDRQVGFYCRRSDYVHPDYGARLAIECKLKPQT